MSAFLFSPEGDLHLIPASQHWRTEDLLTVVSRGNEIVCPNSVYISFNGHVLQPCDTLTIATNDVFRVNYRLPGGKGGFGSMLRAIGAQIEKTTSREACRDLSGRRMRDVNDEKKITEWVAKQADRERELAKQKQERLEKKRAAPKHNFDDRTYTKQIQENLEKIDDALKQGFKVSTSASGSSGIKRISTISGEVSKKRKIWMDMDDELDDSDDEIIPKSNDQSSSSTSTLLMSSAVSTSTTTTAHVIIEGSSRDERVSDQQSSTLNTGTSADSASMPDEVLKSKTSTSESSATISSAAATPHPAMNDSSNEGNSSDENTTNSTTESETVSKTEDEEKPKEDKSEKESKSEEYLVTNEKPFNIDDYNTGEELESLGLDLLKEHLKALGLKCGGTLQERAQRLFVTKGKALEELDPSLFAKSSKGKNKLKKK